MNPDLKSAIRIHPMFHGMKTEHLDLFCEEAVEMNFHPGAMIFEEGEAADRFFLVRSGEIVLEAHDPSGGNVVAQCVREGEVFGWSWLVPPFTWRLRARALEAARVIAIDGGRLLVEAEHHPEFGFELMKRVAQAAILRLQSTRRQALQAEAEIAAPA